MAQSSFVQSLTNKGFQGLNLHCFLKSAEKFALFLQFFCPAPISATSAEIGNNAARAKPRHILYLPTQALRGLYARLRHHALRFSGVLRAIRAASRTTQQRKITPDFTAYPQLYLFPTRAYSFFPRNAELCFLFFAFRAYRQFALPSATADKSACAAPAHRLDPLPVLRSRSSSPFGLHTGAMPLYPNQLRAVRQYQSAQSVQKPPR